MEGFTFKEGVDRLVQEIREKKDGGDVLVVGIGGASGSGKTYFAKRIANNLQAKRIGMDRYYKGKGYVDWQGINFDMPEALGLGLLRLNLKRLRNNNKTIVPIYSMKKHMRDGYELMEPFQVILIDGIFALHNKLRGQIDIGAYLRASFEVRLKRRLKRDLEERGREKETVIKRFMEEVEPMFRKYVQPTKKNADYIINNGEYVPDVSLDVPNKELKEKLKVFIEGESV